MADEPNIKGHRYYAKENHIKLLKEHLTKSLILADAIELIDGGEPPDVVAPTISSTSPADNSTNVLVTVSPTITFSEAVVFGTGLITLRQNIASVWSDVETFDVATEVGTGNGQVSISGAVLTINPTASLTNSREYAIRVAATAIEDAFGNAFAGVTDDTTISFTTEAAAAPSVDVPGEISSQPLVGQVIDLIEPQVTGADSVDYQWYHGAPTTTPIIGANSADYTPVDADYGLVPHLRITYTNAAGDTVVDIAAPDVVGRVFNEDWSAYTAGDTRTQLDTLYDFTTGSGLGCVILADAAAPSGKVNGVQAAASNARGGWLAEATAFATAKAASTTKTQALWVFRHRGVTSTARYSMRFQGQSRLNVYSQNARLQIDTQDSNTTAGTFLQALVAGGVYCVRLEQEGAAARIKLWEYGDPEPETWSATGTCSVATDPTGTEFAVRYTASPTEQVYDIWWHSAGYNADAQFWDSYVPPPPSTSDLLTFSAASSVTSVSFADSAMVINLEDV